MSGGVCPVCEAGPEDRHTEWVHERYGDLVRDGYGDDQAMRLTHGAMREHRDAVEAGLAARRQPPAPSPAAAGLPAEDVERVVVNNGCTWCGSHCQCGAGITYEDAPVPPDANGGEER